MVRAARAAARPAAADARSRAMKRSISTPIHTLSDIAQSRQAGHLAADVLRMLVPHVRPGVSTNELDKLCHDYIVDTLGCIPANIGYHGYTKTICASVNHVVCHGIPSDRDVLKDGDIVNVDVALIKDG
ncbi:M24 family metallopeptidase, partial [Acidovorax sp. CCYZU-2555]|uniref:M24 family metallopeptidase n=1 Tax=Acidovorax sp. CCYZU-2555 TaxID=2835042 RepID=UPI0032DEF4F4